MQTTDKKLAEELKATKAGNGKRSTSKESAKVGANRIAQFVNAVSDQAAPQVADAIAAATIQKAMQQLGLGDGPLTKAAMAEFSSVFCEVLIDGLPELTGAIDSPKFLLPFGDADGGKSRY